METSMMSESLVDASDVEETVTQVLTQLVQDGGEEDQMSVEFLQEQEGVIEGRQRPDFLELTLLIYIYILYVYISVT